MEQDQTGVGVRNQHQAGTAALQNLAGSSDVAKPQAEAEAQAEAQAQPRPQAEVIQSLAGSPDLVSLDPIYLLNHTRTLCKCDSPYFLVFGTVGKP
ncbi:MAG: hypothetical protein FWG14_02450 [Peptococcaceae bacterium]|nr:hypothetical protein [Peptococcaceae bacterium]